MTAAPVVPPPSLGADVEYVYLEPSHACFVLDDVLVQIWETATPKSGFDEIVRASKDWKERHPTRGFYMMSIVAEQAPMPDGDARRAAAVLPLYFSLFVGAVEGGSFRSSLVRGVLASMMLLSPRRGDARIVGHVSEAVSLLAGRSVSVGEGALTRAIDGTRATMATRRAAGG